MVITNESKSEMGFRIGRSPCMRCKEGNFAKANLTGYQMLYYRLYFCNGL